MCHGINQEDSTGMLFAIVAWVLHALALVEDTRPNECRIVYVVNGRDTD